MKSFLLLIILCFTFSVAYSDTIPLKGRVDDLERNLKQIDANQLNYKIEKDLLKETYSNNYERINFGITFGLGVIGILGFLGMRGITDIKKEYAEELSKLRQIQNDFEVKSKEIDIQKLRYETGLEELIKENQEQNNKIKFIELKDKAITLFTDKNYESALDFVEGALAIHPDDIKLLTTKARLVCIFNRFAEALEIYNAILKENPQDGSSLRNLIECMYFNGKVEEAKALAESHPEIFTHSDFSKVLTIFYILELYILGNKDTLLAIATSYVTASTLNDVQTKDKGWSLEETKYYIHYQPESELKNILKSIIWYLDGHMTGQSLLTNLGLTIPIGD